MLEDQREKQVENNPHAFEHSICVCWGRWGHNKKILETDHNASIMILEDETLNTLMPQNLTHGVDRDQNN